MNDLSAQRIACPFCGLVCDDLLLTENGVDARGCAKGAAGFARRGTALEHRVKGRSVPFEEAVSAAAALLGAARQPLVTGLAVDVAGLRALLALADRIGAIVDRWQSAPQFVTLDPLQREGAVATTFSEIANRADVVVLLGRDPDLEQPRFFERLLRNPKPLYRSAPPYVAFVGPEADAPNDKAVSERIAVGRDRLLDALGALSAHLHQRRIAASDLPLVALGQLGERLAAARYGVIVWDVTAFPEPARGPASEILLHLLRYLTRRTRCVGLPLGGGGNAPGASQTMLWQTGWPGRLSLASGTPRHDPWLYDADRLVTAGEIDALLWASTIAPVSPPVAGVPTVALVAPDTPLPIPADVEIRVGIPALDHRGTVMRADTVVALPLAAARPSGQPSVAAAASAILAQLGAPA